jgi:hypothetical protein
MPDWSQATSDAARRALAGMTQVEELLARLSNIDPVEDRVWQAVLQGYVELGRAPGASEIAGRTAFDIKTVRSSLRRLQARDLVVLAGSAAAIAGAYPFTERATPHRVHLGPHVLNAMCAIDALAAGAMYGEDIEIESACHQCRRPIAIKTTDRGRAIEATVPEGAIVWAGLRYANNCAATSLCRVLAFFCSDEHLDSWRTANGSDAPDGVRLTLAEAMEVGRAHFMPILTPAAPEGGS